MSARPISATAPTQQVNEEATAGRPRTINGSWLTAARAIWAIVAIGAIAVWIAGIPDQLHQVDQFTVEQTAQLRRYGISPALLGNLFAVVSCIEAGIFVLVGALIFWRKSHDRMAWIVAVMLIAYAGIGFPPALQELMATHPVRAITGKVMLTITISFFYLLFFIFPDARFRPGWSVVPAGIWALQMIGNNFFWNTPLNSWHWPPILTVAELFVLLPCAIYAQIYRFRRVPPSAARQQMKWLAFGMTTTLAVFVGFNIPLSLGVFGPPESPTSLVATMTMGIIFPLSFVAIPATLAIAILAHRLFEIDLIINRTLVYGALTAAVIGIYVLIVGYLGAALHDRDNLLISLIATGIVAILFQPLRERLQRAANHLLYGQRDDPYAVLSQFGRRLEATLAPDAMLPAIVETVAATLKLPYVAVRLFDEGDQVAGSAAVGFRTAEPLRFMLTYRSETVGELLLAPRGPGEAFSQAERQLLGDLARHAGVAVHAVRVSAQAVRLADDLQLARQRLVTAREAERRRLRRDLHDGLGPRLASISMRLETAREQLPSDSSAIGLMTDLSSRMQDTIADIRRLVYALRPPALDDLGLVAALSEWAVQLSCDDRSGLGLTVAVESIDTLPPLPAAVEVAAYRIVQEALTNVARHSAARRCQVQLAFCRDEQELRLGVIDDGVGLASMRERAEELGGSLTIGPAAGGGTFVQATLPCHWES